MMDRAPENSDVVCIVAGVAAGGSGKIRPCHLEGQPKLGRCAEPLAELNRDLGVMHDLEEARRHARAT